MGEESSLDIMVTIIVLSLILPLIVICSYNLNRYGLNVDGTQIEKSAREVTTARYYNTEAPARPLLREDIFLMIAIGDSAQPPPSSILLVETGKRINFDINYVKNRSYHLNLVNKELTEISSQIEAGEHSCYRLTPTVTVTGITEWRLEHQIHAIIDEDLCWNTAVSTTIEG